MKAQVGPSNKSVSRVGFWSAVLVAVWTVWFVGAFGDYMPSLPSEWPGIEAFAASFESSP